jgi:rhodanese-related sulfurtransferase
MKNVRVFLLITFLTCALATVATAAEDYNYIAAKAVKDRLDAGSPMIIVDICPAQQFAGGHLAGSIETNAYPVKTDAEKGRLAQQLAKLQASADDIVVVCPGGAGGAKRTVDFYKTQGVDEKRLLILEQGMNQWPYETEKN